MKGYAYDFLAILHAVTVIFTLLWLPFGKFFHIFQRPAQLGGRFYKDAGRRGEQARVRALRRAVRLARCTFEDLIEVERETGLSATRCADRRALPADLPAPAAGRCSALAQATARWQTRLNDRRQHAAARRAADRTLTDTLPSRPAARSSTTSGRTCSIMAGTRLSTGVEPDTLVKTHCCFCGQQCGIQLKVKDNEVIGFEPWEDFPFNQGMLCPKGVKRYLQGSHPTG